MARHDAQPRRRRARTLMLGGHKIKLKFVAVIAGDADLYGLWDPDASTIWVSTQNNQTQAQLADTIIHEALHAIVQNYNFNIAHPTVHVLATALQQMLAKYIKNI